MANGNLKILMVCLGNICRSPMAEGILRYKLKERGIDAIVDSAGTGDWHSGENPDMRATQTMRQHGIDISNLIARQFKKNDFDQFDLIFAMDEANYKNISKLCTDTKHKEKLKLILQYIGRKNDFSVPDPWYGDMDGFEKVYELLDQACEELIKKHFT